MEIRRMKVRCARTLFPAIIVLAAVAVSVAADWPQFRGPTGQGIAAVTTLPTEWSPTKNIPWKTPVPGEGWSSPILWKERIYLTTAVAGKNDGNLSLRALCFDAHNGRVLWNTEVITASPVKGHQKNSHASPTPVTDGERLYVHFGPYGTAALDLRGAVLWRNTNLKYSSVHGNGGSPVLVENALIFSADAADNPAIIALNKANGFLLWRTQRRSDARQKFSFSTPLAIGVSGRSELISPASGAMFAYDPRTGRELWQVRYGGGYSVIPRPVFGHGLVFVSSGFDRPSIYAVRPGGTGDVTETRVEWSIAKGAPNTPSPLLVEDELYFVSDGGIMSCVDAKTGKQHWQERVGGNHSASPVFGAGKIYVQSEEGAATVLKAGRTFSVLARNDLKERTLASWAVDEGKLYIRTAQHLYRIQDPVEKHQ